MKFVGFLILVISVVSCAPLSMNRSFIDAMDDKEDEYMVPGKNFDVVPGDSGSVGYKRSEMMRRTPASAREYPQWTEEQRLQRELRRKISSLSEEQKIWLRRNENFFESDSQKLYYLGLSADEQDDYIAARSMNSYRKTNQRRPSSYFKYSPRYSREVYVGMDKGQVAKIWGNPHRVDVAGDPSYGNERWTFVEHGKRKYVYFAQGKVEGWATE